MVKLARFGARDAWRLVVAALGDASGQVADEAAWLLAELEDSSVWSDLYGGDGLASRDELVRLRVAEAVGRQRGSVDGGELVRRLTRSDPRLSRRLLWSIERLASAGRLVGKPSTILGALESEYRSAREEGTRAAALCAFAAAAPLSPEPRARERLERAVRQAYGDRAPELRSAALLALGALDASEQRARALAALEDPARAVRLQAIEVLRTGPDRTVALALAERLASEETDRVAWRIVDSLRATSGLRHPGDPRPWRDWANGLPEDWLGNALTLDEGAEPEGRSRASFGGLPVVSDALCFLVDFSGSLWFERSDGSVRKTFADRLLKQALEALPPEARFNVIPYTGVPHPWRPALVPATEENVRDALAWFEACTERGSGNVYDAARLALDDPAVDSIVCLTDGAPTGGAHWKLELIVPLLVEAMRFRRVAFDSVLIDAPTRLARPWAELARLTGGRSLAIDAADARVPQSPREDSQSPRDEDDAAGRRRRKN